MKTIQFQKRMIFLRGETQKNLLDDLLQRLPMDEERPLRITIDCPLPSKSRDQEALYHILIGDIARQYVHCGRTWSAEDMKRILIDQFRRDTSRDPDFQDLWVSMGVSDIAPSFDGSGVVALGVQSRNFPYKLASVFIDWLYALGDSLGIKWTERKPIPQPQYNKEK